MWNKFKIKVPQNNSGKVSLNAKTKDDMPVFCFRYINDKYSLDNLWNDKKEGFNIIKRILEYSKYTRIEIDKMPRQKWWTEKISKDGILKAIPSWFEYESILSIRYDNWGLGRIIWSKSGNIFHVLFLDNQWKVYRH